MKNTLAPFAIVGLALVAACTSSMSDPTAKDIDGGVVGSSDSSISNGGTDAGACEPKMPQVAVTFLNANCMPCHNATNHSGRVVLDSYAGVVAVPKADSNGVPSEFASVGDVAVDELTGGGMPLKFNTSTGKMEPKPMDASAYAAFKTWVNAGLKPAACP